MESEVKFYSMKVISSIFEEISKGQLEDVKLERVKSKMIDGKLGPFEMHEDGSIRYKGRWCVPMRCGEIKKQIMEERHNKPYSVHPGGDKL